MKQGITFNNVTIGDKKWDFMSPGSSTVSAGRPVIKVVREGFTHFFSAFPGEHAEAVEVDCGGDSTMIVRKSDLQRAYCNHTFAEKTFGAWIFKETFVACTKCGQLKGSDVHFDVSRNEIIPKQSKHCKCCN